MPIKQSAKDTNLYFADWDNATAYKVGEQAGITFNLVAISWEQGHLQDGRYASWRDIRGSDERQGTRNRQEDQATKPVRKVGIRKP